MLRSRIRENEITISLRGPEVDKLYSRLSDLAHLALPFTGLTDKSSNNSKSYFTIPETLNILHVSKPTYYNLKEAYCMQEEKVNGVICHSYNEVKRVFREHYKAILSSLSLFNEAA